MKLKLYVAAVAILATAVAAAAARTVHVSTGPSVVALLLMGSLVLLTEYLQLRHYHYRGHGAGLNLMEGVLAPVVYFAGGLDAMLICASALLVADVVRRMDPIKVAFNVAQWTLAAGVASLVVHEIVPRNLDEPTGIAALSLAIVVMSVLNQAMMTTVLWLATSAAQQRQATHEVVAGFIARAISNGVALIAGLALVAAYRWNPYLLLLGFIFIVGIDAAGRANATVRADHVRLEGLQRATHALATSVDAVQALPVFLAEARLGFEVQEVQLVLFTGASTTVHSCSGGVETGYRSQARRHELAEVLADRIVEPQHFDATSADPVLAAAIEGAGHRRVLAAPLRAGGHATGMLLLLDRLGMEGFEAGELKVAGALARELIGFLERVELLHEIEEERRKLADILDSTSDGILTIDADGTVTSWNAGLAAMTGYDGDEMVGTRHIGLLRPRDGNGRDVLVERWTDLFGASLVLPEELQVVAADGQLVWLSCSYSRIPAAEGRPDTLVVVARNITQARELERLKDDFVAVVSHELRTPLVPIKGWAQTLLNRGDRLSDDQRRTAVQSILAQAQKLESLVLNILEASRIEAGRSDGDGVADVGSIAVRIVEDTLSARPDRTVRIRPASVPCQVRGSSVWVERSVSNLVANAIKYSPDDEPVDVAITVDGSDVVVSVTDRGPGIASDSQERIFERFERLEETRKQTGTGLGLYITRRLARAMGGEVSVSSVPGAGSTFLLRLPLAPVAAGAAKEATVVPEQRHPSVDASNVVNLR